MAYNRRDDDLAYGDYHGERGDRGEQQGEGERGIIGDIGRQFFGGKKQDQSVCLFLKLLGHCTRRT